jgi:hypothetical protein
MDTRSFRTHLIRTAVGSAVGGSLVVTAGLGLAHAEPPPPPPPGPDGLVNVVVGGTVLLDSVPVAEATQSVAGSCALPDPAVSAMVAQVDATGVSQTACTSTEGDVVLVQNGLPAVGTSPVVPGTEAGTGTPEEPAPAAPPEEVEGDTSGAGAGEPPEVPEGEDKPEANNPGYN